MFFDWLSIEQDFGFQLPILSDVAYQRIHLESGEASALSQPTFQHRGSFCDVVSISIRGSVLKMTGNPSRWGRLDNLFGLPTVDACVMVFNKILLDLKLPVFTKCTRLMPGQSKETEKSHMVTDGALIKELHITLINLLAKGMRTIIFQGFRLNPIGIVSHGCIQTVNLLTGCLKKGMLILFIRLYIISHMRLSYIVY
ncbi:hypothetical protein [Citrobacter sp. 172116965]|uniref:hypothetical protein n=1 Tax=Citrobacter sp. 172116965 TaxID=2683822 RepID=UPI0021031716|nr:hypothetical protein [Citrobacter sp. 172116965]